MKKSIAYHLAGCAAIGAALAASGSDTVLWPSGSTELRAQTDSRMAPLPDGAMDVKTGVKYRWPGVRMDFVAGECDLSAYGGVTLSTT